MFKHIFHIFLGFTLVQVQAQIPAPGQVSEQTRVYYGAEIHQGNGQKISNGTLVVKGADIVYVGNSENYPAQGKVDSINCRGKHIYPGFIATNTTLGLTEIDAVRATRDYAETGLYNPHVRAQIAYNTDSKIIPTVRYNGVLITQATPRGALISGQSCVMQLDAWNWEDATISASDGIHLNWPPEMVARGWWAEPEGAERNAKRAERIAELRDYFSRAAVYANQTHQVPDMKMEGMRGLFRGTQNLYIHADKANDIIQSVQFALGFGIKRIVIVGGEEAWMPAELLKQHQIPVILRRVHELPTSTDKPIQEPFTLAAQLHALGIRYCLSWEGDMEAMNNRNLPFGAGTTVAYGVPYEAAVQSISLNAATILGIDRRYGSLETGKSATFFISSGDALDIRSNQLIYAAIDGRNIALSNHQLELYQKFSEKYGQKR